MKKTTHVSSVISKDANNSELEVFINTKDNIVIRVYDTSSKDDHYFQGIIELNVDDVKEIIKDLQMLIKTLGELSDGRVD